MIINMTGGGGGGGADTSVVTATAADVLENKIIVDADGNPITGTMANNGAANKILTIDENSYTIPEGYHDGNGVVSHDIVNLGAVSGIISTKAGKYTIPEGYHDGTGSVAISSTEQAKIIAGNIAEGKTILGVTGTYVGKISMGTFTKGGTGTATVSGIGFKPKKLLVCEPDHVTNGTYYTFQMLYVDTANSVNTLAYISSEGKTTTISAADSYFSWALTSDGFTITATSPGLFQNSTTKYWLAVG